MTAAADIKVNPDEFEWIQLRKDLDDNHHVETKKEKFMRKFTENPLIPVGCVATASALSYGLWCFQKGNSKKSQIMMRARIIAQGFTVVALVFCVGASLVKKA